MRGPARVTDQTITLSAVRLPDAAPLRREMPLPPERRSPRYVESFDALTLVYDAFRDGDTVVMICPRLLNLWRPFRDGLRLDGVPAGRTLRRRVRLRYEELRLKVSGGTPALTVEIGGATLPIPVGEVADAAFAGRRCLLTHQKDTPPEWIEDWLRFHVASQGVDAALIFDNGSTLTDPVALQERLSQVEGLAACRVVSDPFPYGDKAGGRRYVPTKFLQVAMLNLARLRFLRRAAGVLSLDLDEFLRPLPGGTIFDLAARSPLGLVSFNGLWVYPAEPGGGQPQRAHGLVRAEGGICANPKWCAIPGRRAARLPWAVHRPAGPFFPLTLRRDPGYWHFFATSTGWKSSRATLPETLVPAPELRAALDAHLP